VVLKGLQVLYIDISVLGLLLRGLVDKLLGQFIEFLQLADVGLSLSLLFL